MTHARDNTRPHRRSSVIWAPATTALALAAGSALAQTARGSDALKACEADIKTLCPDVQPGQGRLAQCLRKQHSKVSDDCKAQMKEMREMTKDRRAASMPK